MRRSREDVTLSRMAIFFKLALWVHIAAGAVALATFWIPLVVKKGGKLHRFVGWVYVGAASVIAFTALIGCARILTDERPRNDRAGVYLAYVALLAASNALIGVRAQRAKARTAPSRNRLDIGASALLLLSGLAIAVWGIWIAMPLYIAFGALGVLLGSGQLRFWLRAPRDRTEWLRAHMAGMGTSCIATVTAFLVINARHFGLGTFNVFVWVTPAVLGGVGLSIWTRRIAASSRMQRS